MSRLRFTLLLVAFSGLSFISCLCFISLFNPPGRMEDFFTVHAIGFGPFIVPYFFGGLGFGTYLERHAWLWGGLMGVMAASLWQVVLPLAVNATMKQVLIPVSALSVLLGLITPALFASGGAAVGYHLTRRLRARWGGDTSVKRVEKESLE